MVQALNCRLFSYTLLCSAAVCSFCFMMHLSLYDVYIHVWSLGFFLYKHESFIILFGSRIWFWSWTFCFSWRSCDVLFRKSWRRFSFGWNCFSTTRFFQNHVQWCIFESRFRGATVSFVIAFTLYLIMMHLLKVAFTYYNTCICLICVFKMHTHFNLVITLPFITGLCWNIVEAPTVYTSYVWDLCYNIILL